MNLNSKVALVTGAGRSLAIAFSKALIDKGANMKSLMPVLLFVCMTLSGCMDKDIPPPDDLIEEDTYIDLLVEMQLVKSLQERVLPDSNVTDSLLPKIMKEYEITIDQFERSHNYYQQQIPEQQQRISEAIDRLRRDQYMRDPPSKGSEELN